MLIFFCNHGELIRERRLVGVAKGWRARMRFAFTLYVPKIVKKENKH